VSQAVKITDIHEGLDFFFGSRAHALKLVDFLQVGHRAEGAEEGGEGGGVRRIP
jgi:NMD protein affecting ribosome stability and mRNA decay